MPVANTSMPSGTPSANSGANAPASVAVDFMALLGEISAAPAQANAAVQAAGATLPMWKEVQDLETKDADAADVLGLMPLSLPTMPLEPKAQGVELQTMLGVTAMVAKTQADVIAPEAQLLTDLIQPDASSGLPKFEIPPLTTTAADTIAPSRQPEAAYGRPVHTPVGTPAWADDIGSRLTMMVEQGKHIASLRLSPEHLGPLEIRIAMKDDQASVWFGAAHADTRAAIENALPKLREMFAQQGLSLADAGVSREPPRQQANPAPQSSTSGSLTADTGSEQPVSAAHVRLGLFDAYA